MVMPAKRKKANRTVRYIHVVWVSLPTHEANDPVYVIEPVTLQISYITYTGDEAHATRQMR